VLAVLRSGFSKIRELLDEMNNNIALEIEVKILLGIKEHANRL
jgi:hypothetical protein